MKIKARIKSPKIISKDVIITPQWLLENFEDDLLTKLVCESCPNSKCGMSPSGDYPCYGECVDTVIENGYDIEYRLVAQ